MKGWGSSYNYHHISRVVFATDHSKITVEHAYIRKSWTQKCVENLKCLEKRAINLYPQCDVNAINVVLKACLKLLWIFVSFLNSQCHGPSLSLSLSLFCSAVAMVPHQKLNLGILYYIGVIVAENIEYVLWELHWYIYIWNKQFYVMLFYF